MMGCSLKDAMSRRISGVNAPPTADAPENIYKHSYKKSEVKLH
jgi:hypothetical protein